MQNSYIVDVFLSGVLWMITIYLVFDLRARISAIDEVMAASTLTVAMSQSAKLVSYAAIPFCLVFLFLVWRFYGLMVISQSWGYGGMGLLAIFVIIGMPMIWLNIMLIVVHRSPLAALSNKADEYRRQSLNKSAI